MMGARTVLDPDTIIHADTDMLYHIPSPPSCTGRSAICHSSRILHRAHASSSTTFDDGASDDLFSERYPPTQSNHASHISISSHHRAVCCVSSPRIRIMRSRTGCFSNSDHFYVCPVSASLASHSTLLQVVPLTANGAVAHDIYSSVTTSFIVSHTIPILFVHIPPRFARVMYSLYLSQPRFAFHWYYHFHRTVNATIDTYVIYNCMLYSHHTPHHVCHSQSSIFVSSRPVPYA